MLFADGTDPAVIEAQMTTVEEELRTMRALCEGTTERFRVAEAWGQREQRLPPPRSTTHTPARGEWRGAR